MTNPPITVRIVDVFPEACELPASQVIPGDLVFDPMGGKHPVDRVVKFKHIVRIVRTDGTPITLGKTETITVVPTPRGAAS